MRRGAHALGDARRAQRDQRASARQRRHERGGRTQRHRRELSGTSRQAGAQGLFVLFADGHRGADQDRRLLLQEVRHGADGRAGEDDGARAGLLRAGGDVQGLSGRDLRSAQGQPDDHRRKRGRDVAGVGCPGDSQLLPERVLHRESGDGAAVSGEGGVSQHRRRRHRKAADADHVGRRGGGKGRLRALHDEGDPRAAQGGGGYPPLGAQGRADRPVRGRADGRGDREDPADLHRGVRFGVSRGGGGEVRDGGSGAHSGAGGAGVGVSLSPAAARRRRSGGGHQPVGRDGGQSGGAAGGQEAGPRRRWES